jgi:CheY-like chemotaxis protein
MSVARLPRTPAEVTCVVVVDDNPVNLKLIRLLLAAEGYDVRTTATAAEAMATIRAARPRVVLMDIQLPGTDGLELTRQIKADPDTRDTLVLAITAYAMKGDEAKAIAAGCDGYFTKPIDTRTFPAVLAHYLAGE